MLKDDEGPRPGAGRVALLVLVLAGSAYMAAYHAPAARRMLDDPSSCFADGVPPSEAAQAPHDRFCAFEGTVTGLDVLVASDERRLFVRLHGRGLFAALPDSDAVKQYRAAHTGALPGFAIASVARVVDPDREPAFAGLAERLRARYRLAPDEPLRLVDTTDTRAGRWPFAVAVLAMGLNAVLALVLLARVLRARRRGADVNSAPVSD